MVRSASFFVLACLLALTVEGLLWSPSHSGGAVEEPCRFAQVQVSSSEVYRSDFTSCFVLLALPYICFSSLHQHTHTAPPSDHLTTTAPIPRPLGLITAPQQPEALYPSTSPTSPHLHVRQASCMHSPTSTPLHICPNSPAVREGAQSLPLNPCSSPLFSSLPLTHISIPDIKCCRTLLGMLPVRNTLTTGTCPGGWYLGTWDVPLGRFTQLKRSPNLKLPNSHQATHTRMTHPDSLPMQPSPKPTHIFLLLHAGLPTGSRRNIHRSPGGRNESGSQPRYHQDVRPPSQSLRSDYGHKRQADGGNGGSHDGGLCARVRGLVVTVKP